MTWDHIILIFLNTLFFMEGKRIIDFLKKLSNNNNREWFHEHKAEYDKAKDDLLNFADTLIPALQRMDPTIGELASKQALFRIHRDVRFSKDKRPYKTHFGLFFAQGGRKSSRPGYYLHIEPEGKSFIGGGIYAPEKDLLFKIRQELLYSAEELIEIISAPPFTSFYTPELANYGRLKRIPVGFPKDFEYGELIKNKHFVVDHRFEDSRFLAPDFKTYAIEAFEALAPFNKYFHPIYE